MSEGEIVQVYTIDEQEVLPVIRYEDDSEQTHDGEGPCTDPTCPCWQYGYALVSLVSPRGI